MPRLFLIRHGETASNAELRYQGINDTPLDPLGLRQAQRLAAFLKSASFDKIYASDLDRAYTTAKIIAKPRRLAVQKLREFRERDFGCWENMLFKDIRAKYDKSYRAWLRTPAVKIKNAETFSSLKKRVLKGLGKVLKHAGQDENIVIVAHGGPNRVILMHFLGLHKPQDFWKLKQDNACLNIIDIPKDYGHAVISLLNYHPNNTTQKVFKY